MKHPQSRIILGDQVETKCRFKKKEKRKEVEQANPWEKVKLNVLSQIMVTVLCCEEVRKRAGHS